MNKAELKEAIHSDLFRYHGKVTKVIFLKDLLFNTGFRFMYIFRKCQYYRQKKWYIILYIVFHTLKYLHTRSRGCDLHVGTKIGRGLYIGHMWCISIHSQAIIGCNVNIHRGVIIGKTDRGDKAGTPTIGNKVWLGTNSIVVGNITIGDNTLVAPGAYVNFDVPGNSIVVGNPGKIISSAKAVDGYVNNTVKED